MNERKTELTEKKLWRRRMELIEKIYLNILKVKRGVALWVYQETTAIWVHSSLKINNSFHKFISRVVFYSERKENFSFFSYSLAVLMLHATHSLFIKGIKFYKEFPFSFPTCIMRIGEYEKEAEKMNKAQQEIFFLWGEFFSL